MNPRLVAVKREAGKKGARSNQDAAAVKRDLRAGHLTLSQVLDDPRAASVPLFDLCLAVPRWGRRSVPRFLDRVDVRSNVRVRELTTGQLERLRLGLANPGFRARRQW